MIQNAVDLEKCIHNLARLQDRFTLLHFLHVCGILHTKYCTSPRTCCKINIWLQTSASRKPRPSLPTSFPHEPAQLPGPQAVGAPRSPAPSQSGSCHRAASTYIGINFFFVLARDPLFFEMECSHVLSWNQCNREETSCRRQLLPSAFVLGFDTAKNEP